MCSKCRCAVLGGVGCVCCAGCRRPHPRAADSPAFEWVGGYWTGQGRDTSEVRRRRRRRTRPGCRRRPLCSLLIRHATRERQEKKRHQGSSHPSIALSMSRAFSHMKKCYYSTTCMHTARSAPVGSMSARKPHQRLAGQAAVTPATLWTTNPIPALWIPQQGSTRRRMQGAISHPARVCEAPIAVGCADAIHEPCSRSADGGARQAACAAAERRPSTCGSGTAKSDADIIDWTMTSRFVGDRNLTATAKVPAGPALSSS